MARPKQSLLTRQRIVEVASALVDAEGLEAVSVRRLATELGVQGPSLYNHFATKAEILDAVANAVVAQVDVSAFATCDWRDGLRLWAHSYHAVLSAHPNIVPVPRARSGPPPGRAGHGQHRLRRAGRGRVVGDPGHPHRRADALPRDRLDARLLRARLPRRPRALRRSTRTCAAPTCSPSTSSASTTAPSTSAWRPCSPAWTTSYKNGACTMTSSVDVTLSRDKLFVGGAWVAPATDATIAVENPATEEVLGHVPAGTAEDVDRAVAAARAAFDGWAGTPMAQRGAALDRLHAALAARTADIAKTVGLELGTPLKVAKAVQAGLPLAVLRGYADTAAQPVREETVGNSLVVHEPVGVVGAITPWNYPLHQVVAKVGRGAGGRLHRRAQAERADAAGRVPAVRRGRGGRTAGRRAQPGARHRPGGRRGDRRAPGRRHGVVHRLHRDRPGHHPRGRRPDRPGGPRTGRQVGQRDPRRRRPRQGGEGGRRQRVPQLGPDLHGVDPDAGPPRAATTRRCRWPPPPRRATAPATRSTRRPGSGRWSRPPSATGYAATSSGASPTVPA